MIHKIALLGAGGSGKSSILEMKKSKTFQENKSITIGVDIEFIPIQNPEIDDGKGQFYTVDLGGQQRFQLMHDAYIKGIEGALIVFDLSRYRTFVDIPTYIDLVIKENISIPILLVGNKIDLISKDQEEQYEKDLITFYEKYRDKCNLYGYIFTSAKNNYNIEGTFAICEEMILWEKYPLQAQVSKKAHQLQN
ncbi:MAG: GTP-binding protein [Candidatus Lokiarchaeota archaeon]|nr:GTP-binding protein [Candidatus Harpocratesius repetitus]